jgi:hypothetical protein
MKPCAFCGSTDGRPSREHAVPKWARRAFPLEGPLRVHMGEGPAAPEFLHERQHLNITVNGAVCEPLLQPMLVEHAETVLDVAAQKLLATWAVKTVFLVEQSFQQHYRDRPTPGHQPSDAELAWITRGEPPPRSQVWLSCVDAAGATALRYEPSGVPIPTRSGELVHAHLTSFALGYVALQVFTIDFLRAESLGAVPSWPPIPARLRETLLPIWPATKVRRWPPPAFPSDQWHNFVTWDGVLRTPSRQPSGY